MQRGQASTLARSKSMFCTIVIRRPGSNGFARGRNKRQHESTLIQGQQQNMKGRVYVSTYVGALALSPNSTSSEQGVLRRNQPCRADDLVVMSPGVFSTLKITPISILAHIPDMLTLRSALSTRPEELLA